MDKFEYQAKLEEINKLVEKEEYDEAAAIADTIEWKRVRSVRTLCMISEIYEAVGRVEDSKSILYRAYRRTPNSRQILYRLTEACVQTQDFDDAVEYYTEYVNLAPNDNSKYILKYEIYKGRGSSVEEQIQVLEELKSKEYTEQWAYELAKLYDQAGMTDKCIAECDDLALWFHNGKYVVMALELKQKYAPLTPEQQTVYDNPSSIVDMETKEAVIDAAVPTLDEEIMKELPKSEKEVIADSILMDTEKEIAASVVEHKDEVQPEEGIHTEVKMPELKAPEVKMPEKKPEKAFDTVGLQNELANSMRQILSGMKPSKKVADLEKVPEIEEPVQEEMIEGQMSLDDFLTQPAEETKTETPAAEVQEPEAVQAEEALPEAPAAEPEKKTPVTEQDILTAETIDISKSIKKEIGDQDLRSYIAEKAARERAEREAAEREAAEKEAAAREAEAKEAAAREAAAKAEAEAREAAIREAAAREAAAKAEAEAKAAEEAKLAQQAAAVIETPEMPEIPEPEKLQEVPVTAADAEPEEVPAAEEKEETTAGEAVSAPEEEQPVQGEFAATEEYKPAEEEAEEPKIDPMSYTRDGLDEKEKHMLGFWSSIRGMNDQVNAAVTQIMRGVLSDKTSSKGNVVLVGDAGNGRTTLALGIAKIIGRCKGLQSTKVAKIYAEDLNSKDIAATINKVSGGVLIIEEAGDLNDNAIAQLAMAMSFKTDSLIVILEDERRYIQDLLARNPQFAQKFDVTINVPMLTNDELVEFGKYYALQNDCVLDDSAVLTLYDGIGVLQNPEQPVAILDVKEIMDKAIRRASKFSLGKLFSTISGKRYDDEDRIIIKGKNFKKIK